MDLTEAEKDAIRSATREGLTGDALLQEVESGRLIMLHTGRQSFVLKPKAEVPEAILKQQEIMRQNRTRTSA